ncbi:MAG: AAA family ATPase, partial [Bacteroidota bacterium]|nr:AAA family ATPase [Bacteroidota bacterium]
EIGGKNKTRKQIAGIENSYIAADNIEFAYQNKIPLWLFGFLY